MFQNIAELKYPELDLHDKYNLLSECNGDSLKCLHSILKVVVN